MNPIILTSFKQIQNVKNGVGYKLENDAIKKFLMKKLPKRSILLGFADLDLSLYYNRRNFYFKSKNLGFQNKFTAFSPKLSKFNQKMNRIVFMKDQKTIELLDVRTRKIIVTFKISERENLNGIRTEYFLVNSDATKLFESFFHKGKQHTTSISRIYRLFK